MGVGGGDDGILSRRLSDSNEVSNMWSRVITVFLMFVSMLFPFRNAKGEKYYSTAIICHPCYMSMTSIDSSVIKLFNTAP